MRSVIPWMGGKFFEKNEIIPKMPYHRWYVEVFAGSCVLLLNKPRSPREFANDKFSCLVSFWEVLKDYDLMIQLRRRIMQTLDSRYLYRRYMQQDPEELDILDRAYRFLYLTKFGFNSFLDTYHNPLGTKIGRLKNFIRTFLNTGRNLYKYHKRIQHVNFSNEDFRVCLNRIHPHEDIFLLLDPPYINTHSYDKGYYDEAEKGEQMYVDMRTLLEKQTEGGTKWMITCNQENEFFDQMTNVRTELIDRRACINKNKERRRVKTKLVMNYPKSEEGRVYELEYEEEKQSQGDFTAI